MEAAFGVQGQFIHPLQRFSSLFMLEKGCCQSWNVAMSETWKWTVYINCCYHLFLWHITYGTSNYSMKRLLIRCIVYFMVSFQKATGGRWRKQEVASGNWEVAWGSKDKGHNRWPQVIHGPKIMVLISLDLQCEFFFFSENKLQRSLIPFLSFRSEVWMSSLMTQWALSCQGSGINHILWKWHPRNLIH